MTSKQDMQESSIGEARSAATTSVLRDENFELDAMATVYKILQRLVPDEQARVLSWVEEKLGLRAEPRLGSDIGAAGVANGTGPMSGSLQVSAKRFLADKKPSTDVERMACLAFFQTHMKSRPKFKTRELTELNKEAAQPPLSNPAFAVVNATNAKYLAPAGGGYKQITVRGETLVEALPDREKVKAALNANPLGRRRRRSGRSSRGPAAT